MAAGYVRVWVCVNVQAPCVCMDSKYAGRAGGGGGGDRDPELQKSGIMQMNPPSDNGLQRDLSQLIEAIWNELRESL